MLGAAVGSFLNVVIYRLPVGLSLLHPPSRCPKCHTPLKPYDNVPVLGWLWLRGKCRYCRAPIAARYPLIEALTGTLFLVVFMQWGFAWVTLAYWVLLIWLVALTFIDLDTLTLPNPLTQSGLVLGLAAQTVIPVLTTGAWQAGVVGFMSGVLGAVLGIWLFDIITLVASVAMGKTAMGGGDAKLAAMLGAWLGWQGVLLSSFLASVLGAVVGGGAIALGWVSRRQPLPFGPFLALGSIMTLLWGEAVITVYRVLFFPMF
jgi:leader peptidase (prepilin peptidase)/N-methyltransferase